MFNNFPTLNRSLSMFVIFMLLILLLGVSAFIIVSLTAAFIVPLTWLWSLIVGDSYDSICDSSDLMFRINQIGRWAILFLVSVLFVKHVFFPYIVPLYISLFKI